MQKKQKEPIQSVQILDLHSSKHYHLHPIPTSKCFSNLKNLIENSVCIQFGAKISNIWNKEFLEIKIYRIINFINLFDKKDFYFEENVIESKITSNFSHFSQSVVIQLSYECLRIHSFPFTISPSFSKEVFKMLQRTKQINQSTQLFCSFNLLNS